MDTRKVYENLVRAVRTHNEVLIGKIAMTVFSDLEVRNHHDRLNDRLHGERGMVETLAYRKRQFAQPSSRSCGRSAETLSSLRESIDNLTEDVRILSRLAALFGSELNRRGSEVCIVVPVRHNVEQVAVR